MSHLNPGLISAYNSLTDKHLAGYFSNTRIRRHLQRAGLITRSGRIVPDKEYRHKLIQRAHQRHVRECLAQAIFHKVLEMERLHQIEIKRKLEEFARRERVHKIKVERSKRYEEDIIRILSPRPPTGARGIRKQHSGPEGEHSESSESPSSSRPNTAPGKMQRPVRLKPIHSNSTTASMRRSSPYRLLESSHENNQSFNCTMDKESRRRFTTAEASHGISPYCLPVINNFVTPVPPTTKRKDRGVKVSRSSTIRGRRLRPTTASSGDVTEDPPLLRSSVHQSRVVVNMVYFGKSVHLSHDLTDMRDEVKVFQQHCGGENLCVYKGKLLEGETFQFISRRHRGFPFSLTFFLNGLQVERLSSCCEFKHRKGSRLGGRHGHFGFSSVEAASPCYKCIIAMGLDKKPTPPPKRVREDAGRDESVSSPKDAPERTGEDAVSQSECETSQPQDMETQVEKETAPVEDKVRDDYEEDFEADDEAPTEDEVKEEKSPSPATETEKQTTERDASETEDNEKDEDIKSHSGSSSSGSNQEESDAEDTKDTKEEEKAEQPKEVNQEETVAPPDEKDDLNPEEVAATEGESAVAKDSDIQDSAADSTEIDISDTSVPSGNENRQSDDTSGVKDAEKTVEENKPEEEQERAKSVQEKLAEAILKESQCSSEPELSDTSTEEEEDSTDKGSKQDKKDAAPEKLVPFTDQSQTLAEATKCEESVGGEGEVAQEQEESSDTKEQKQEEPHEDSDGTKDEKVSEVEEDEKAAEKEKSEDASESLHPVSEENVAQDDKTADPLEETPTEPTDAEAAEKDKGEEGKTDIQHDETGQGGKSGEEDESSVSELNKKADETADNAEAEAMTASETMEMKAESSEEQEALSREEAPVADTEGKQQEDGEDVAAASETEVAAEDSSSSPEGSGDTIVEKTVETSEEHTNKDDVKEEASGTEASRDDSQQERYEGEERTQISVEIDEKVEEQKSEKEEQTHTHPEKTEKDENTEEREEDETNRSEEEGKDESKADEMKDTKENTAEGTESDTNVEGKQNEAEKTVVEEDTVANEEKVEEPGKTEKDETSECVENKNEEEESGEKGADKSNEGEDRSATNTAVKDKSDEAEKPEKDEQKAEQSEVTENKNGEECEEIKDDKTVGEGGEKSAVTEELEKSADAVLDKENGKKSPENVVESEDVCDSEAADGTKTTEDELNDVTEAENVKRETERASNSSEKGEIDAENGEISTEAESRPHEDDGVNLKVAETGEEVRQREEQTEEESTGVKELTVESGNDEDGKVGQAPDTIIVESEAKKEDESLEMHDELTKNDSEPETSGVEMKEDPKGDDKKGSEETEQDENGNKSEVDNENKEADLIEKNNNVENNIDEVIVVAACSEDREQSPAPVVADLDDAVHKLDENNKEPLAKFESVKNLHTDENAVGVSDVSAADVENGADTEEASKASEEGASVLLKPQAQNKEADRAEQSAALSKDMPEILEREDNRDLVTNWVNVHQTSKYFETFVEPLEDLKDISDSEGSKSNKEEAQSAELQRSESPGEMVRMSEDEGEKQKLKNENESKDETKVEAVESDLDSIHSGGKPSENEKDALQVEKIEVKSLIIPRAETELSDQESANRQDVKSEDHKGSRGSIQGAQDGPTQGISEENGVSKTKVESISGSLHSGASGKPESVPENQTDEKTTRNDPDMDVKPTETEAITDLQPSFKPEERQGSKSPEGVKDVDETSEKPDEPSREVTEITDFTTSKSDDGSQEESRGGETQTRASDGSRRDVQLIEDIKHTLSKDRLSSFSVDETLFGRSSYPLLTTARTESGH